NSLSNQLFLGVPLASLGSGLPGQSDRLSAHTPRFAVGYPLQSLPTLVAWLDGPNAANVVS
ncbi:MAG: hypothetical protein AAF934_09205, partial [Bacteroidota bacterium]